MASVSAPPTAAPEDRPHPGRALVVWSWLMIPMFALWFLPAFAIADGLKALIGLNEEDPLAGHGIAGALVGAGGVAAFLLPFVAGVVLAWLAHRRGARTAAVVPLVVNLGLVVGLTVLSVLG